MSALASERAMLEAYRNGQDLYAVIAQKVYNNGYWDNMEHWEDGSPNPDGKKRRGEAKSILLGLMYGRGTASIAEQMGCTYERAQEVTDKFFNSFPDVKTWVNKTQEDAKKFGYVEDFWGRRRRLPDIQLPQYTITDKNASDNSADFNPLLGCRGLYKQEETSGVKKYQQLLANVKSRKDYENIKAQALKEGIEIRNNGSFIAQAERQCVNSRIQGSAATLTKIAMNKIHVDKELKALGFRLLLAVHDELIGECPKENAEAAGKRLCQVMVDAAVDVPVPFKCDDEIEPCWYFNDRTNVLNKELKGLEGTYTTADEVIGKLIENNPELSCAQLCTMLPEHYTDTVNKYFTVPV